MCLGVTTAPPLILKIDSPVTVHLPQQFTNLQASVEPSNRRIVYKWTYKKDGPVMPIIEVKYFITTKNV